MNLIKQFFKKKIFFCEWIFFFDNEKIQKAQLLHKFLGYFSLLKSYFRKEKYRINNFEISHIIFKAATKVKKKEIDGFLFHSFKQIELFILKN